MTMSIKHSLLTGTAIMALGAFLVPQAALAGSSANLVVNGGAPDVIPPTAGQTLQIQDNTTDAVWDADDGVGGSATEIEFLGGGAGDALLTIVDSTAGPTAISVSGITVTDDANQSTIIIDGTSGSALLEVTGDIVNVDGADGNDLAVILSDSGNSAGISFNGSAATSVNATIDGAGGGEGSVRARGSAGTTFNGTIGANNVIGSFIVDDGAAATTNAQIRANDITVGNGSSLTANDAVNGTVSLSSNASLALGDNVVLSGDVLSLSANNAITMNGNATLTGAVGSAGNAIGQITTANDPTKSANFQNDVYVNTMNVGAGNVAIGGDLTGNANFTADGTVQIASGSNIAGNVDNTAGAGGTGRLVLQAAGADISNVSGTIGAANSLREIALNGDGAVQFGDTVNADRIVYADAAEAQFNGHVTSLNGIDMGGQQGTARFANGVNLTGDIVNGGHVVFQGANTVNGAVGRSGSEVETVQFAVPSGETIVVTGEVAASDSLAIGAGTVQMQGAVTADSVSVANGTANFSGTLDVAHNIVVSGADGSATLNGVYTIGGNMTTDVGGNGELAFNSSGTITGNLGSGAARFGRITLSGTNTAVNVGGNAFAADTVDLGTNRINAGGTFDLAAGQTLNATINDENEYGRVTATGVATVDADAVVNVTVNTNSYISDAERFLIVGGQAGGGNVATINDGNLTITGGNFLLSFAQDAADTDNLAIVASRVAMDSVADNDNNRNVGRVLDALGNNGDNTMDSVQAHIQTAANAGELNQILESLIPTVDGGAIRTGFHASVESINVIDRRLEALHRAKASGVSSGNRGTGGSMWAQGFGQQAEQDRRGSVAGYESDTYGIAFGVDTQNAFDNTTLGMAASYARSNVDSSNVNRTEAEVDSYQISMFGDYSVTPRTRVEAMAAYAYNDIGHTRYDVGLPGNTASADYDSHQFILRGEVGHDIPLGGSAVFTPSAMAHYQHIRVGGYSETGAGGAGLSVDTENLNVLELGIGGELSANLQDRRGGILRPAIHAGYRYDVIGDEVQTTSRFTGGGASFKTNGGEPDRGTANIGASILYAPTDLWSLSAAYDYEMRGDYDAHAAYIRAGYHF